jgi:long-chain acyl-CoA synthetase
VTARPAGYVPIEIADGIRASAARTPRRIALQHGDRELTYGGLVERIDRVANGAHGLGLTPGQHSAVMAPNCLEFVELTLGLASAGTPAALVNAKATGPELAQVCDDSEARVLFVHASLEQQARAAELATVERIVVIGGDYEDWLARARAVRPDFRPEEWDTFMIPYTTGTTGGPKGVLISHRSRVLLFYALGVETGAFAGECRSLAVAPMHHMASFLWAVAPLFFGGRTAIQALFHPEMVMRSLARLDITAAFMVPTHYNALFELGEEALRRHDTGALRTLVSGAGPLSQTMKERITAHFGEVLHEQYGATEAGLIARLGPADQLRTRDSVGRPLACTTIKLVDAEGLQVPPGEIGELYARSPFLFNGYWNQPEETARCLRDGFVTAGDLARRDEEGFLYLVDRTDDKIVSGGVNVHPSEVEQGLAGHPAVAEVCVFAVPDEHAGETIRAAVVLNAGHEPSRETELVLFAFSAQSLAQHKRPKGIDFVESLPRNEAGQVMRRKLREPFWAGRTRQIA